MLSPALHIDGATKTYRDNVRALMSVDLRLGCGVFGLLGPNGAGKTTLLRLLATLIEPTSGRIALDDLDSKRDRARYRSNLGYLPQRFGLHSRLTAHEHVLYFASLKGITGAPARAEAERLIQEVGLSSVAGRQVGGLSGGMKQRIGIAGALLGSPRLIVVDEPTAGLDPEERIRFRTLLERVSRDAVVILSTHIVQDVDLGCSRVAVIAGGRILHDSSPDELAAVARNKVWTLETQPEHLEQLKHTHAITSVQNRPSGAVRARLVGREAVAGAVPADAQVEDGYVELLRPGGLS